MPPQRPVFPSEPNLRRLGVGGGGNDGDRVLRAQLVIALVLGFTILAVLLYLLRRPSGKEHAAGKDGGADAAPGASARPGIIRTKIEESKKEQQQDRVSVGQVQRVKCSAGAHRRGNEGSLCDSLPFFEESLARAIRENADCGPKTGKEGTVNYVLTVDFVDKRVHVFPGASGTWKGPQAKRAAECVKRALPAPQWEAVGHQYRYYMIAIMATYSAPAQVEATQPFE
jgi:hypothetical protein